MGKTPLDFAWMRARLLRKPSVQMEEYELGQKMQIGKTMTTERGLTQTVEISEESYQFEMEYGDTLGLVTDPVSSQDRAMIDLLMCVGATTGSETSREENLMSSLIKFDKTSEATNDLTQHETRLENSTASFTSTENTCTMRDHCKCYNELESRISSGLEDVSKDLTPEEAVELVRNLKKRKDFKRRHGSRILCLDGGGIRGLITLSILQEVERRMEKDITEMFDWIIGTSTGGIIALGLCYGEHI